MIEPVRRLVLTATAAAMLASCSGESYDGYLAPPSQYSVPNVPVGDDLRQVAKFDAQVLVLSRQGYRGFINDDLSKYSPFDLAVAWGDASRKDVYSQVHVHQRQRYYMWNASGEAWQDKRVRAFARETANWHIIPQDEAVEDALYWVGEGDVVSLSGYLVDIHGANGMRWKTSRTRTDTGAGACEIFLVTEVKLLER